MTDPFFLNESMHYYVSKNKKLASTRDTCPSQHRRVSSTATKCRLHARTNEQQSCMLCIPRAFVVWERTRWSIYMLISISSHAPNAISHQLVVAWTLRKDHPYGRRRIMHHPRDGRARDALEVGKRRCQSSDGDDWIDRPFSRLLSRAAGQLAAPLDRMESDRRWCAQAQYYLLATRPPFCCRRDVLTAASRARGCSRWWAPISSIIFVSFTYVEETVF